jgi:hypothetical protein
VRRPWAWAVGAFALAEVLRRRREPEVDVDPRAEELRLKLAESRDVAEAEPAAAEEGPESRRRAVHESGRATVEQMRKR